MGGTHATVVKNTSVAVAVSAISAGTPLAVAPDANAETYCGESSRGAAVYAGNSDTSCEFARNTAEAYHAYGVGTNPFSVYSR